MIVMVEKAVAGFTFDGGKLKAIVNAYRQLVDSFVFRFTREDVTACVMDPSRARMMQIVLTPYDYQAYADEAWVRGDMRLLWGAVKDLRADNEVRVSVRDGKLYVGTIQPGTVVPEDEILPEERFETPKLAEAGSLHVVVAGFKGILRSAPPDTGYVGLDIEERGGHLVLFDEKHSVIDLREAYDWLLGTGGRAKQGYDLSSFVQLLVSGLSEAADIRVSREGPAIIEYAEADYTLRFFIAPLTGAVERMDEILATPRPSRTEILLMRDRGVKALLKAVKAIGYLSTYGEITVALAEELTLHWEGGCLRISMAFLERYEPVEPISGVFRIKDLVGHLKDVEDLRLYLDMIDGERRMVLWGTGLKVAPRELSALELKVKVEVPEVMGAGVFTGPVDLLRRTVEDAKVAEDAFLVFYTTPYEIEAFGRNAVYYEATFELDDFQAVAENYVPIASDAFDYLIGFLRNVPAEWCTVGKTEENDIYLSCETDVGELRATKPQYRLEEAVRAYEERVKRPPAPPEVEELPVAPPPPPVERVTVYMLLDYPEFVGVDGRSYGPYRAGEAAWVPRENAEELVEKGWASWEKPTPPAVALPTPPPEEPSPGELYLQYYTEALARHRAAAATEEIRTVSRVEEHEAEEEAPAELHVEEAIPVPQEELSQGDLYMKYYKEALARQATKT